MLHASPYFDPLALRHELTALFNAKGDADKASPEVIVRLKKLVAGARAAARAALDMNAMAASARPACRISKTN